MGYLCIICTLPIGYFEGSCFTVKPFTRAKFISMDILINEKITNLVLDEYFQSNSLLNRYLTDTTVVIFGV